MKFGLKKKTIIYCSRTSRFAGEFDYFYELKDGKIFDEGEKEKIQEKFKGTSKEKLKGTENLGLGNKSMIFQLNKHANGVETDKLFDLTKGKKEFRSILFSWRTVLLTTLMIYIALTCGVSKILMFRYFTLILYQLGDSKEIDQIVGFSMIYALAFLSMPIYEYVVKNVFGKYISSRVHSKIIYRMLLTPAGSMANNQKLTLKTTRDITNLESLDEKIPEAMVTTFYQISFIIAIIMVLYVIVDLWVFIPATSMFLATLMFVLRTSSRDTFIEMEGYIHSKWLALNLDIFQGLSVVRACNYDSFFQYRLFDLEERKNMAKIYLLGNYYRSTLLVYWFALLTCTVPCLAVAYMNFTASSHIPCLSYYFVFIMYMPAIFQSSFEGIKVGADSHVKVCKMLKETKEKYDMTRRIEEQAVNSLFKGRERDNQKQEDEVMTPKSQFVLEMIDTALLAPQSVTDCTGSTTSEYLIHPFSLKIKKGEKVAIVADKCTCVGLLSKLILKIIDNYSGQIIFNGKTILNLPSEDIRSKIFYLDHDCGIFPGTLAENLFPQSDVSDFKRHEFTIVNLLESFCFEGNHFKRDRLTMALDVSKISSTDRLVIGIVRCYIETVLMKKDIRLVILDNSDSRFNAESYARLKSMMDREFKDLTIMMICSVPKVSNLMETVHVFKNHALVESGRVADLDKNDNSSLNCLIKSDLLQFN